jgi:hypothetical protein
MENEQKPTRENSNPIEIMSPAAVAMMDQQIEELRALMKESVGYQITISTRIPVAIEGKDLKHNFFTNSFSLEDMISSHAKCGDRIEAEYKRCKTEQ